MTPPTQREVCDVLIIGAGPAGLTAATALAPRVSGKVLVLEREAQPGGIPRHSDHPGYGIRDVRRFISGPKYARHLATTATGAGAEIRTRSMVTGWTGERTVEATSPTGRQLIEGKTVILATGARERPRPARLIPGDRPAGVYTTGQLQNLVYLHEQNVGSRAVIVGAELVSYSAAMTLRHAGCRVTLMTSQYRRPEAFTAFALGGRLALGLTVATRTRVVQIHGRGRVESIELENLDTHARRTVACDTVVFTGDWIPDHELARAAGLPMDPHTHGPVIDSRQATPLHGVFAIGNLVHPVDTADVAALDGRAVAEHILRHLGGHTESAPLNGSRLVPSDGLKWISPSLLDPRHTPPRGLVLAWPERSVTLPRVTIAQDGRVIATKRLPWSASPGRVLRIPVDTFHGMNPAIAETLVSID